MPYKTSSTYAPVFSTTFTMPSPPSGYSYLTNLSSTLLLNAKPSIGTLYALRPKLEVSAKATPWVNELGSYLPLSGGTITGAMTFNSTAAFKGATTFNGGISVRNNAIYPSIELYPTSYNCKGVVETGGGGDISLQIYDNTLDTTNRRQLILYSASEEWDVMNAVKLRTCEDDSWTDYAVYHQGNIVYVDELPFWGTQGQICLIPVGTTDEW